MTDDQITAFMERLEGLADLLDAPLTPGRLTGYAEALRDVDLVDLVEAMARAGRECQFFPKPVDLRAFAVEARVLRRQAAREAQPRPEPLTPEEQQHADEAYQVFLAQARAILRRRSLSAVGRAS